MDCASLAVRTVAMTPTPSRASRIAQARPIPVLAPVTTTKRFEARRGIGSDAYCRQFQLFRERGFAKRTHREMMTYGRDELTAATGTAYW
jgi:hypothetical protein